MGVRCLITGANGMLGRAVEQVFRLQGPFDQVVALGHGELDITDQKRAAMVVKEISPAVIVNCAAYTNVDGAEADRDNAFRVNALGPKVLSGLANEFGARLIHVSTDYVFSGEAAWPYWEYMARCPKSAYGQSKALGEHFVEEECRDFLIVRTSWLFGPGGRNFVGTIHAMATGQKEIKVVNDQRGRPTYTKDLARALLALHQVDARGIYHFCNSGDCTWFDLAKKVVELSGTNTTLRPISTEDYPRPAKRPAYSVLATRKYSLVTGHTPRPWKEAVKEYLDLL